MRRNWRSFAGGLLLLWVFLGAAWAQQGDGIEKVRKSFENPPDDTRVMMRWWWFGPAVTKEEISRELNVMKEGGIGGIEIAQVYPLALDDAGTGIKNMPFLSDESIEAIRYANEEARSLGLRVDITLCSGWPYGGPSVPIEQASGMLRVEHVKLVGGEQTIPAPYFQDGEKLDAAFLVHSKGQGKAIAIDPSEMRQITKVQQGITYLPTDLPGANEVLFFISSRTKQQVKRACVGAEGYVLDHYDQRAVKAYLNDVGERLLQAFGDKPPYAIFCDSLEVFNANWTPNLLDEFKKRRGYDLRPYLPALVSDMGPRTDCIRHDWGQTLTELFDNNFAQTLHEWAACHKTRLRMQAYGVPPATMSTYRDVDLFEGEGAQWNILRASRWASSACHLYGHPVTSAETWTWLHSPVFTATPLDMKAEADQMFLQGINQLVGQGWPYSPPSAGYPGWCFYASGALNDNNPWWIVMPDLMKYLQRMSYILRQGQPKNDIALYMPNSDAWAQFHDNQLVMIDILRKRIGDDVIAKILESGHNLDFFDDEELRELGKVDSGTLCLGSNKYKTVVLPNVESIPLDTLKKLDGFAHGGGTLIATRRLPAKTFDFPASDAQQAEVRDTIHHLFEETGAPGIFIADENADLSTKLDALIPPDVEFSDGKPDLGFVHRQTDDADIYFIANTGAQTREMSATFRIGAKHVELWNPMTGISTPVTATTVSAGRSMLPLKLNPYESLVVIFSQSGTSLNIPPTTGPETLVDPSPIDISDNWNVSFKNGQTIAMNKLHSWTDDQATQNYSGLATYEKQFNLSPGYLQPGTSVQLDFGQAQALPIHATGSGMRAWIDPPVREAAVVYVNGQRAGAVWHPPYEIEVGSLLRPGANQLKIIVGNTAVNSLAGSPLPDYKLLTQKYGERFKQQDMNNLQPIPSGLMGPIRLLKTTPTTAH